MNDITPALAGSAPQPTNEVLSGAATPVPVVTPRPRVWPAILIVALLWICRVGPGLLPSPDPSLFRLVFFGPMVCAGAIVLWWIFASRVPWLYGGVGVLVFAVAGAAAFPFFHKEPDTRFLVLILFALPTALTAWVGWLAISSWLPWRARWIGMLVAIVLGFATFTILRHEGVSGQFTSSFSWRWNKTAEDKFLDELASEKIDANADITADGAPPLVLNDGDWPAFRGTKRDGRRDGVRIDPDWSKHPPEQLWRHRVGPGWGSFAVVGDRAFTQEQWGKREVVVCYDANTGKRVWVHGDEDRFADAQSGAGPRATPTFADGKLYTQGAAGRVSCLNAATGKLLWSSDVRKETGAPKPMWGFAASPLVVGKHVITFAGAEDKSVVAFDDTKDGELAWNEGDGQFSYCSPQLAKIAGVEQVLLTSDTGLTSFDASKGTVLWKHKWQLGSGMNRVVQPAVLDGDDVLLATGFGNGTRRLHISRDGDKWDTETVWQTRTISPYFNDLVVHKDHIYGFDTDASFLCLNLSDGKETWRVPKKHYVNGQVLLLPDQDLLLILSETGEVALVEANPERHKELARFQAIDGKTWNHPVIAGDKLFVRNGEEAACYRLRELKSP